MSPSSKLATSRSWDDSTLASELGVQGASEDELYAAMDWLLLRQERIEAKLAKRHLSEGGLVLYDVTSSYVEGERNELAAFGHNRDKKRGKQQVTWGLMTDGEGRPVAVEAFPGNTSDVNTLLGQVRKLKDRFALSEFVLVGDRGMISGKHIQAFQRANEAAGGNGDAADAAGDLSGVHWVTALRSASIRALVDGGALQPSLFEQTNLLSFTHPDYPGERLIACFNPFMAAERREKRQELLAATLSDLAKIEARVAAGRLKDATKIALAAGKVIGKHKMEKHLELSIGEGTFSYRVDEEKVKAEAALDGIYVIRTSVPKDGSMTSRWCSRTRTCPRWSAPSAPSRAWRCRSGPSATASVTGCAPTCSCACSPTTSGGTWSGPGPPLTFKDEEPRIERDPIAPAQRSDAAERKARSKTLASGEDASSFKTLLTSLATITRSTHYVPEAPDATFTTTTEPDAQQRRALDLLDTISV